eukprot:CAMPEP_0175665656 /NCGR_PEP_ID=MMETSP0097-20121207/17172_1 /TAXON_ID=311494 /ORGANISM="Alexandrium monilatum, Strain CCMP3105" /LENGTH=507 /DNA_ID=CAMNT_0016972037 /DNA_START=1 /DNA_END=1520 /DNA_ORIENTATION=-
MAVGPSRRPKQCVQELARARGHTHTQAHRHTRAHARAHHRIQKGSVAVAHGGAGEVPLAEPVGVDHKALLVGKLAAPLDPAGNKVASRQIRHRRVRLQEGKSARLEVTLCQQTRRHCVLAVAQVAALEVAATCYAPLHAVLEADLPEAALPREGDVAHLLDELHLREVAGLQDAHVAQLEPHAVEVQGLHEIAVLEVKVHHGLALNAGERENPRLRELDGSPAFRHPHDVAVEAGLLADNPVERQRGVAMDLGVAEVSAHNLPVLAVLVAALESAVLHFRIPDQELLYDPDVAAHQLRGVRHGDLCDKDVQLHVLQPRLEDLHFARGHRQRHLAVSQPASSYQDLPDVRLLQPEPAEVEALEVHLVHDHLGAAQTQLLAVYQGPSFGPLEGAQELPRQLHPGLAWQQVVVCISAGLQEGLQVWQLLRYLGRGQPPAPLDAAHQQPEGVWVGGALQDVSALDVLLAFRGALVIPLSNQGHQHRRDVGRQGPPLYHSRGAIAPHDEGHL